ncbi:MAG TPA: hypothetical protein VGD53_07665 [Actinoallomurus sp.]
MTLSQFLGLLGTTPAGHPPAFGSWAEGGVCALAIACLLTFPWVEESLRLRLSRAGGLRPRHPSPPDVS